MKKADGNVDLLTDETITWWQPNKSRVQGVVRERDVFYSHTSTEWTKGGITFCGASELCSTSVVNNSGKTWRPYSRKGSVRVWIRAPDCVFQHLQVAKSHESSSSLEGPHWASTSAARLSPLEEMIDGHEVCEGGQHADHRLLRTRRTLWINVTCSSSSSPVSGALPLAAVAAITVNLSFSYDYLPARGEEPLARHRRQLPGAHVNLTENTIESPATWNMFSHA